MHELRYRHIGGHDYIYRCQDSANQPRTFILAFRYPGSERELREELAALRTRAASLRHLASVLRTPWGPLARPLLVTGSDLPTPTVQTVSEAETESTLCRLNSVPSDFTQPLWQCHGLVLEEGGFVIALRFHHVLFDGGGGTDACAQLLGGKPLGESVGWRRATGSAWLGALQLRDTLVGMPKAAVTRTRQLARLGALRTPHLRSLKSAAARINRPAQDCAWNLAELSPGRSMASVTLPFGAVEAVARWQGCTINDVAVAAVCSAILSEARKQGVGINGYKVWIPVVRRSSDDMVGSTGTSLRLVVLDESLRDAQGLLAVLPAVVAAKDDQEVERVGALTTQISEYLPAPILRRVARAENTVANTLVSTLRLDPNELTVGGQEPDNIWCCAPIEARLSWMAVLIRTPKQLRVSITAEESLGPLVASLRDRLSVAVREADDQRATAADN